MHVFPVTTGEQLEQAIGLRMAVFVGEQGFDAEGERDRIDDDPRTLHALLVDDSGSPVGTARLVAPGSDVSHGMDGGIGDMDPEVPHIGRVVVLGAARGTGGGRALMELLEDQALERFGVDGRVRVEVSAQRQAMPFYRRLGYTPFGDSYLDEHVWHQDAYRIVTAEPRS
ncbi:GNAT family N-acetyltransferase [Demequina capsici]|uniref:GNAT family N-acetyltransferase n=1 Tax=Demequina capsici TaxID=3075620 RepID=A0AA96F7H1_9MICO|nr:GNAT family N-acetyltransferase [Demequina sp. OYTSA14]WNM23336.1 GNAT family N-acetyltransferase [Demequina sp. OYTSA14]